jgi:hypothetical protein
VQITGLKSLSNEVPVEGVLQIVIHLERDSKAIRNKSSGENYSPVFL